MQGLALWLTSQPGINGQQKIDRNDGPTRGNGGQSRDEAKQKRPQDWGPFSSLQVRSAATANALDHRLAVVALLDDDGAAVAGIDAHAMATPMSVAVATAADTNVDAASFTAFPNAHALALATATHVHAATIATAFSAALASISVTTFAAALGRSSAPSPAARSRLAAALGAGWLWVAPGLVVGRSAIVRCSGRRLRRCRAATRR